MNKAINKIDNVKQETIFDHNPTQKELDDEFLFETISKEDFIEKLDRDSHYYAIYRLYLMRGDKKTAEKYYLMISEETRKEAEETKKNRVIA